MENLGKPWGGDVAKIHSGNLTADRTKLENSYHGTAEEGSLVCESSTSPYCAQQELKARTLEMIGYRPITTKDSAGVSILFYKGRSAALEGIPANRKTPGFFLFWLQLAHRAEDHLGSIHSSHVSLYLKKKGMK